MRILSSIIFCLVSLLVANIAIAQEAPPQSIGNPIPLIDFSKIKVPDSIRNVFESAKSINQSFSSGNIPEEREINFNGIKIGDWIKEAIKTIFGILMMILAWIINLASQLVLIVAAIGIAILNWLIELIRELK